MRASTNRTIFQVLAWLAFLAAVGFLFAAIWVTAYRRQLGASALVSSVLAIGLSLTTSYLDDLVKAKHKSTTGEKEKAHDATAVDDTERDQDGR